MKLTNDVMQWVDAQLAQDPGLRERVEQRMAELRLEEELVALREARGLTQGQLAKLLGISQPAVAKIEAGRQRNIGLRTLMNFITALGGELLVRVKAKPAKVIGLRVSPRVPHHAAPTRNFISGNYIGRDSVPRDRVIDSGSNTRRSPSGRSARARSRAGTPGQGSSSR